MSAADQARARTLRQYLVLRAAGLSYARIGRHFGVPAWKVYNAVRREEHRQVANAREWTRAVEALAAATHDPVKLAQLRDTLEHFSS